MDHIQQVELAALVEKLDVEDLPSAAARLLRKWCEAKGVSHEAIYAFYAGITEEQSGSVRDQLDMMSASYSAGGGNSRAGSDTLGE